MTRDMYRSSSLDTAMYRDDMTLVDVYHGQTYDKVKGGGTGDYRGENGVSYVERSREAGGTYRGDSAPYAEAAGDVKAEQELGGAGVVGASGHASDEDPASLDDRKQKRMLSNRESARRSRLRKQHHLDELRGQVALLRNENSDMLNKYTIASRHFGQLTEENRALRSHAMDLSRRLHRLHQEASAAGHPSSHEISLSSSHLDNGSLGMSHMGQMSSLVHHHAISSHPHMMSHGLSHAPPGGFHHPYNTNRSLTPELSR